MEIVQEHKRMYKILMDVKSFLLCPPRNTMSIEEARKSLINRIDTMFDEVDDTQTTKTGEVIS